MKVMVGGTFDPLHGGHRKLLERSFELAGEGGVVIIGLTTDRFASLKKHPVRRYVERREDLIHFIKKQAWKAEYRIEPLDNRYGEAAEADFDALVVSEETLPVAIEINRMRHEKGLKKVDIHQIACVLAEDGRWISSTRILKGEIDPEGRLIR
ncbi:MAG: phosphopantetheine adenylyltransferase [Methanomicrobiales archaeon]|nr:phosphopantetheine adenylyltransferase [Methanomicrobiales archaeon]